MPSGFELGLRNIVEDVTPELGGNLDVNGSEIISSADGNIVIAPNGSGVVPISSHVQMPDDKASEYGDAQDYTIQWDGDDAVHTIVAGQFVFTGGSIEIDVTTSATGQIIQNSARLFHTYVPSQQAPSNYNVFIGYQAGSFILDNTAAAYHGTGNVAVGAFALDALTTGFYNFALGTQALTDVTTGSSNVAIGYNAGANIKTTGGNVFIGREAGDANENASNVAIGAYALRSGIVNGANVAIGESALRDLANGKHFCIAIGNSAGRDEDQSDRLIIDNRDQGSAAATRTNAIIYGVMDASPANQLLTLNAKVGIGTASPHYLLTVAGAISGLELSADPAEPAEGECIIWMSDGTQKGDDGDILIASKAGGVTKWTTLFDHSAGAGW